MKPTATLPASLLALLMLAGCMSQQLESYVGQDVRMAQVDLGAPHNAFDLGDGRRAFQWTQERSYTEPTTVDTAARTTEGNKGEWTTSSTVISGGRTVNTECVYTLFAEWSESADGWIVVDYKKPPLECE